MNAKAIATAYIAACDLHEASWVDKGTYGVYDKTWEVCAAEATPDQDIAFIVCMAHITGFSDWHDWATEVLARPEDRQTESNSEGCENDCSI